MMKVEVWSDYVCPFCYIGKRRFEEALAQFPHKENVEIEFKSYELDPNSAKNNNKNMYEILAEKYRMSYEEAIKTCENIAQQAAACGLTYKFDTMIPTNTFDAHRLTKYAKLKGKESEITEKLLSSYFTESKHIGDIDTLSELAASIGLDKEEARAVLENDSAFADEVRADVYQAKQIGVKGVPYFVIDDKYAISGAQPSETFVGALQQAWDEKHAD